MKVCRQYHHHVVQRSVITGLTLFLLSLLAPLLSVWTKGPSKAQALVTPFASLIMTRRSVTLMSQSSLKNSLNEEINEESSRQIVEVCGFKDCKRAGGGPKLVKLFNEVLRERNQLSAFQILPCDCQGECGYGPNIVYQALGYFYYVPASPFTLPRSYFRPYSFLNVYMASTEYEEDEEESFTRDNNPRIQPPGPLNRKEEPSSSSTSLNTTVSFQCDGDEGSDGINIGDEDDNNGVLLQDLTWRVARLRLEEAHVQRFLKSGPKFLPYEQCRLWVQAWGNRWTSQQEWDQWIELGEKRNSYIPARPEEYYTKMGKWVSWDHFLGVNLNSTTSSSSVSIRKLDNEDRNCEDWQ